MDDDTQVDNLSKHDFIGVLEFELHEVVTAREQTLTKPLANPNLKHKGTITMVGQEVSSNENREMIIFTPHAKLPNSGGLCFFIIYQNISPGKWIPVYKSEIKKSLGAENYAWN